MKRTLTILAVALGLVAPGAAIADPATVVAGSEQFGAGAALLSAPTAVAAKSCSSGWTHARINGVHKCLRVGQFCAHAYNRRAPHPYSYRHYGFNCTKQDSRGNYHLTYRR